MSGEVFLNIKNIAELLPEKLAEGLEAVGQLVENEAKHNCPVDDGQLRASITHQLTEDLSSVEIGTNLEYAP